MQKDETQTELEANTSNTVEAQEAITSEGDFRNFPQISERSIEKLRSNGIEGLFPVQYSTFNQIYDRKDMIVRDLTGSGKTLGFSLPLVEYLRANDLFQTKKT